MTRLLVVDVQNDFCAPGGWIDRHGADLDGIHRAVDKLMWLIPRARAAGIKPIFVRAIYDLIYLSPPMLERHKRLGFSTAHCQSGTWGADFFGVHPEEGDIVITKHRYSAFVDTELGPLLRAQRVENLIVTGITSNVCVESTARDAYMLDYHVVFPSDCSATYEEAAHFATLQNIRRAFGIVTDAAEIVGAWERLGLLKTQEAWHSW
jgi:ureidoacrylate peracid hydrolase